MGIRDNELIFSDNQAITTLGANDSGNVIDFERTVVRYGEGIGKQIVARVGTAFASGGAATLQAKVQDSADGSTYADLAGCSGATIAKASLTEDAEILNVRLPKSVRRYIKILFTVGTAAMTAGTVNAQFEMEVI